LIPPLSSNHYNSQDQGWGEKIFADGDDFLTTL
jgi:hypothetical protein